MKNRLCDHQDETGCVKEMVSVLYFGGRYGVFECFIILISSTLLFDSTEECFWEG